MTTGAIRFKGGRGRVRTGLCEYWCRARVEDGTYENWGFRTEFVLELGFCEGWVM